MSEKRFRQLPIIDLSSDAIQEPISYIRTGLFHPKIIRHQITSQKKFIKPGAAVSHKYIKLNKMINVRKSPLKQEHEYKEEAPVIFDSINSYLNLHKLKTISSPRGRCKTPNIRSSISREGKSLAVIKRLKFVAKESNFNMTSMKGTEGISRRTEKICVIINSPKIED